MRSRAPRWHAARRRGIGKTCPPLAFETAQKGIAVRDCIEELAVPRMHHRAIAGPDESAARLRQFLRIAKLQFAADSYRPQAPGRLKEAIQHLLGKFWPGAELQHLRNASRIHITQIPADDRAFTVGQDAS